MYIFFEIIVFIVLRETKFFYLEKGTEKVGLQQKQLKKTLFKILQNLSSSFALVHD